MLFSLEGNIGSGKSSLLRAIERQLGAPETADELGNLVLLQEPVDEWLVPQKDLDGSSMLDAFYHNPSGNSFAFQMFTMLTRVRQMDEAVRSARAGHAVLTERCLLSEYHIFARTMYHKMMAFSPAQWVAYTSWQDYLRSPEPTGLVYLETPPEMCMARIQTRDRLNGEERITLDYLESLHRAHAEFVDTARARHGEAHVLVLDGAPEGDAAIEANAAAVCRWLASRGAGATKGSVADEAGAAPPGVHVDHARVQVNPAGRTVHEM